MIIGIDFDGTCVAHSFPRIGIGIGAEPVLQELVKQGHQLVLFTMRSDKQEVESDETNYEIHTEAHDYLTQAVNWFKLNEIPLYGINSNPTQYKWTSSPKAYCHLYIDDSALGCPTRSVSVMSERPFVDWMAVKKILKKQGILK